MFNNVIIVGVGAYHPTKNVTNEFFINHFKSYQLEEHTVSLLKKLGRQTRTLASEDETSLSMATKASIKALKSSKLSVKALDMIIFASDTPEYLSPSCALLIKNRLQASNAHYIFDINSNCTGMLTATDTAARYLKSDSKLKRILVVGSLLISPQARLDDMVAYACTGDGAAAIVLEKREESTERGLLSSRSFTDDSFYWSITMPACGLSKISDENVKLEDRKMLWKPFDFSFLAEKWSKLITNVLSDYNLSPNDVTEYFMSQFSKRDIELTMNKLNVNMEKVTYVGDKYGYTGCTSPYMALDDRLKKQEFKQDELAIFCSVASGYSMTALLYKW